MTYQYLKKCHHNIILGRINIHIALPPSYVCEVWNYSKANIKNIKKAVPIFGWKKAFENLSVDEKVNLRSETLLKIFRNYIPKEKIKFSHCQTPWMNDERKNQIYQVLLQKRSKERRPRKIRSKNCILHLGNMVIHILGMTNKLTIQT